jgi:Lectin C-type domain.
MICIRTNGANSITNGTIVGGTLSPSVTLAASLLSNDTKPFVTIEASQLVLNENGGTLVVEVKLNEEDGAESIWANDDMSEDSKGSFAYLGSFEGHKYYQSSTRVNFTNAQKTAEALGGQLLIIDNQEENQFIASSIRDGAWLGIADTEAEGDWKPFYGNSTYLNFDSNNNQPDGGTNENYAVTYGNRWYDVNQNNSHSFIIEYGPTKSSGIDTPVTIVASGTASGEDYSVETLDVVIPAGSSRKSIVLTGVDDSLDEPIENIVLTVSEVGLDQQEAPVANISETKASVTIKLSDDEAPAVTFA